MYVGFSLSLCVLDILSGEVNEQDVRILFPSTRFCNKKQFDELIEGYQKRVWYKYNPDIAKAICKRLLYANKIIQMRVFDMYCLTTYHPNHWMPYSSFEPLLRAFFSQVAFRKERFDEK